MERNLLDPKILFSCVYNPGVLYTHSPYLGVQGSAPKKGVHGVPEIQGFWGSALEKWGFGGGAPEKFFWDVCWPTILWTHGIGLTVVFSHGISHIKESIVHDYVWYCIVLEERL